MADLKQEHCLKPLITIADLSTDTIGMIKESNLANIFGQLYQKPLICVYLLNLFLGIYAEELI